MGLNDGFTVAFGKGPLKTAGDGQVEEDEAEDDGEFAVVLDRV